MAYLRFESGIHDPSDVVVGALVGSAIGYLVPRSHRVGTGTVAVVPSGFGGGVGASLEIHF